MEQAFGVRAGAISLLIGAALLWAGLPNKQGQSPRFLRFRNAMSLYPPLILVFRAVGIATLLSAFPS